MGVCAKAPELHRIRRSTDTIDHLRSMPQIAKCFSDNFVLGWSNTIFHSAQGGKNGILLIDT